MQLPEDFLEATDEYKLEDMPVCGISFVKDIFEAVAQIDRKYAEDALSSKDQLYGYSTQHGLIELQYFY